MMVIGETPDGCRITKHVGGIVRTETPAERDERRLEKAYEAVRAAGPELLQACTGLLAVIEGMRPALAEHISGAEYTMGEQQAVDYALTIVRQLNPDYGRALDTPSSGDTLA